MVAKNRAGLVARRAAASLNSAWAALCAGVLAVYVYLERLVASGDRRLRSRLRLSGEAGAGLVEYILIILVVAILAIAFLSLFRNDVGSGFNRAGNCIAGNVNSGNC
jgi:Flp pilus assembly pilin Flp